MCRDLYKKSLRIFAKLFDVVKTDLTAQSLQKLSNISESAHLASHVKNLRFRGDQEGTLGRGFEWNRYSSGSLVVPLDGAAGMLRGLLRDKLVNCRSFHIDNYDETGMPRERAWLTPGDVVSIVYYIVVNIKVQVASFMIESQEGGSSRLSSERLLPLCAEEHGTALTSWKSLESLIFRFALTSNQYEWVLTFLENTLGLRHLSLQLELGENHAFFPRLAALGPFRALETLSFDSATLDGSTLSRFLLQHCTTLRTLSLQYIRLQRDSDDKEGGKSWDMVFERLVGKMHCLEQVSLLILFEPSDHVERAHVVYPSLAADDRYPVVPGSEEPRPGHDRVQADRRVIRTLQPPVQLSCKYYGGQKRPYGVAYEGKSVDDFLGLLVRAKETLA